MSAPCPICGPDAGVSLLEKWHKYHIYECQVCGLQFCDPMEYDPLSYDWIYRDSASVHGYSVAELEVRFERVKNGDLTALFPYERYALRWIKRHIPPGSPVLDLGCGLGVFMVALQRSGYRVMGLDTSPSVVARLTQLGLTAAVGSLLEYPAAWPKPKVVTMFETLEHLPDPIGFLGRVHAKFSDAVLIISVPSPKRWTLRRGTREPGDYPPNHLTRWTPRSLLRAISKSGYKGTVVFPRVNPRDLSGTGLVTLYRRYRERQKQGAGLRGPAASGWLFARRVSMIKCFVYWPFALWLNFLGYSDRSMLAICLPNGSKSRMP